MASLMGDFEQRPEGKEGAMPTPAGRVFLTEGTACTKALRWKRNSEEGVEAGGK